MSGTMKRMVIIGFAAIALLFSCSSTKKDNKTCLDKNMKGLTLRWGGHNYKTHALSGYQIDSEARLYRFEKTKGDKEYKTTEIGKVKPRKICYLAGRVQQLFLKLQTLTAPGDSSNFIELINPATNFHQRAVWNVKFETYGSKEFRAVFDTLTSDYILKDKVD